MWQEILVALSLVLVIEGILPFLSPGKWRETVLMALQLDNRTLRIMGLGSMLLGTACVYFLKH